jgi:DNA-binding MarR family transcriptional regulator
MTTLSTQCQRSPQAEPLSQPQPLNQGQARPLDQGLLANLMVVTHFVQKQTMERLTASGRYSRLSLTYVDYITRLAERDHSPGELAARVGISKQACSKVLRELEQLGLIGRRVNPEDSRSSVISLSAAGQQLLRDGIDASNAVQQELTAVIGPRRWQQLVRVLEKLCLRLAIELPVLGDVAGAGGERPSRLNTLLPELTAHFRRDLAERMRAQGFSDLRPGVGQILGIVSREGRHIPYIASILGISKQTVAATAAELDQLGYLCRETDPADKRQIQLRLTARGVALLDTAVDSVREVEASMAALLTATEYRLLGEAMAAFYRQLAEQFDSASVLRARIQQRSRELIEELGVTGARALAQQLMTMTR